MKHIVKQASDQQLTFLWKRFFWEFCYYYC